MAMAGEWVFATRNDTKPIPISYYGGVLQPGEAMPPDEASTVVVCDIIGCDVRPFNPLIEALPRRLHLAAGGVGAWVVPALHQAVSESRQRRPDSAVGLSRSALHEPFVELTGQPPMHYLTNWRMQCGARLLSEGNATVATIAQEVGYDSVAAFARAFKCLVGQPPAAWRRAQRLSR